MRLLAAGLLMAAVAASAQPLVLNAGSTKLTITRSPIRIGLEHDGRTTAAPHADSGLLLGDPDQPEAASIAGESFDSLGRRVLQVRTASGRQARVVVTLTPNQADFIVRPSEPQAVLMRLAAARPGYGLADHAVTHRKTFDTDITGYVNDRFLSGQGITRLVSNFAIYPKQGFAFLVWDPA